MEDFETRKKRRFQELCSEMSECREDERVTQQGILAVISTAITALTVLTGATYFLKEKTEYTSSLSSLWTTNNEAVKRILSHLSFGRILFALSCFVFFGGVFVCD